MKIKGLARVGSDGKIYDIYLHTTEEELLERADIMFCLARGDVIKEIEIRLVD